MRARRHDPHQRDRRHARSRRALRSHRARPNTDRADPGVCLHHDAPTSRISPSTVIGGVVAPDVASFSSRGPALAAGGDILKPDIMAPGVAVLAATRPRLRARALASITSGHLDGEPHIAGSARSSSSCGRLDAVDDQVGADDHRLAGAQQRHPIAGARSRSAPASRCTARRRSGSGVRRRLQRLDGFLCGTGEIWGVLRGPRMDPSNLNTVDRHRLAGRHAESHAQGGNVGSSSATTRRPLRRRRASTSR